MQQPAAVHAGAQGGESLPYTGLLKAVCMLACSPARRPLQVDKNKLLQPLGVTTEEFAQVHTSMAELISELVGVDRQKLKRKAEGGANRELLDATG